MSKWNKKKCLKEAQKYKRRVDFRNNSPVAYRFACENNFLDDITEHMPKPKRYSLKDAKEYAKHKGGRCLSTKMDNGSSVLVWECKEGHRWRGTCFSVVKHERWCVECNKELKKQEKINELSMYLNKFVKKYDRIPRRREFKDYCGKDIVSTATSYFGSWSNFISKNGYEPRSRAMGKVWFGWENLCYKIILEVYQDYDVIRQFKYDKRKTIDFYIPKLKLGIDAKTSNYSTSFLDNQVSCYKKSRKFKKIEFWCLNKVSEKEHSGVNYLYKKDIIESLIDSLSSNTKEYLEILNNENLMADKFGIISKSELINQLVDAYNKLGKVPTLQEFNTMKGYYRGENV